MSDYRLQWITTWDAAVMLNVPMRCVWDLVEKKQIIWQIVFPGVLRFLESDVRGLIGQVTP
jgi:hypothetical protein